MIAHVAESVLVLPLYDSRKTRACAFYFLVIDSPNTGLVARGDNWMVDMIASTKYLVRVAMETDVAARSVHGQKISI